MTRIIRVFPSRTEATPIDELAYVDRGPGLLAEADEVHISVVFSWDLPKVERLEQMWKHVAPVTVGGPALMERADDFTPGMYLKPGYTISSRGCPNKCPLCRVWRVDGTVRELRISDGFNLQDDNILGCSREHIMKVFAMLKRQPEPIVFGGGLESALLEDWHVEELTKLNVKTMFSLMTNRRSMSRW